MGPRLAQQGQPDRPYRRPTAERATYQLSPSADRARPWRAPNAARRARSFHLDRFARAAAM